MPAENLYCLDNFFKKMTDLDSPKKNNDCYFYYYSTCAKGDNCTFRHEPSALGCETMCSYWKEGKCVNVHCNFRHMELRKNRKAIPCYWESQPIGCLKAHCPFMHRNPRPNESVSRANISNDQSVGDLNSSSERKVTAVDSLVVNFEEESDSESISAISPQKSGDHRIVTVKSLEEIRLEKVQAESAAYYSYNDVYQSYQNLEQADTIRQRIFSRMIVQHPERIVTTVQKNKRLSDSQLVLTAEKRRKIPHRKPRPTDKQVSVTVCAAGTRKVSPPTQSDISGIKIKTLEEIRAERKAKERINDEQEVTSTSMDLDMEPTVNLVSVQDVKKKIILRRKLPHIDKIITDGNSSQSSETSLSGKLLHCREKDVMSETASTIDEGLLLEDDDDDDEDMVLLKPEEELLNEIDDYLDITL